MGIKLVKKNNENAMPKAITRALEFRGDKVGGFSPDEVFALENYTDIQLYVLSGDPKGSYEMLEVTSHSPEDAWAVDEYDPAGEYDGNILVTDSAIKPWPINWLSVDDADRVYVDIADLRKAIEFLN